jgi:hypothetical protein
MWLGGYLGLRNTSGVEDFAWFPCYFLFVWDTCRGDQMVHAVTAERWSVQTVRFWSVNLLCLRLLA